MYRILKGVGFILGGLVGLAALALGVVYFITEAQLNKTYQISAEPLVIPSDSAVVARGKHLVTTVGLCAECHGDNLAGQTFDEGPLVGLISVPNLTAGQGGIGRTFTDTDWVRALRHGLHPNDKPVIDMPSNYYYHFSDADLKAIIAYLKTLPPQDNQLPPLEVGPLARIFILQDPSLLPAQVIDHSGPRPAAPEPGVTVEYGQYLTHFCRPCHGENLAGESGAGAGQNLTPGGELATWTEADFMNTLRTGVNPQGRKLDPKMMPWPSLGKLSDDELKAIWLYLQSLPPVADEA
ncbi:MAG: c-type cytochrome [Anaerolineales bacterium]|nr:c-type cytochrome [Anaerolineales bacterium]